MSRGKAAHPGSALWAALLVLLLGAALAVALLSLPPEPSALAARAHEAVPRSGVGNPVTAVLLNFRGYDTLLEVMVLLLAAIGVGALRGEAAEPAGPAPGPVLESFARNLVPVMVVVAGYLLWRGAEAPGGAFQAGAVLGAAGVLFLLAAPASRRWPPELLVRAALALGGTVFLAVAIALMPGGRELLEYPPGRAGGLILLIEAAATLSIGAALVVLFAGGWRRDEPRPGQSRERVR